MEEVFINGTRVKVQKDSGSYISMVNKETAEQIWGKNKLPEGQVILQTLTSQKKHPWFYAQVKQGNGRMLVKKISMVENLSINILADS